MLFQLVLVVGASHLRSLADGVVPMPEGCLSFAFMSTPGACAAQLRTEVLNATVPRIPDLVCVMAPSNNLTASRTVDEGRADFANFLASVCTRWPKVSHICYYNDYYCCYYVWFYNFVKVGLL